MSKTPFDLPDVTVYEHAPDGALKLRDLFKGKKGLIVTVPGAFTPGCSKTHAPGYVSKYPELKSAGAEEVLILAGNDVFVMDGWGKALGSEGIRFVSDFKGDFGKAFGLQLEADAFLGGPRVKRASIVVVDNRVVHMNVEPDGTGLTCSLIDPTIEQLKNAK